MRHLWNLITVAALAAAQPANFGAVVGTWQGTLDAGVVKLRLALHVSEQDGRVAATLDSLDQNARGLPVTEISVDGSRLSLQFATLRATYEGTLSEDGSRIAGTFTQAGALPLEWRRVERIETPARPQHPKEPFPYRAEDVAYRSGAEHLAGTLTLPPGSGPFPAVVLLSGSGAQDRDGTVFEHKPLWVLADHLTRRGIAVLRVDDPGTGGSPARFPGLTVDDMAVDALAGITYLKTRPEIDAKRLGLIGHSEGGAVAPLAASRSADVAFVVMLAAPGVRGEDLLLEQAAAIARDAGASEAAIRLNRAIQEMVFRVLNSERDPQAAVEKLTTEFRVLKAGLSDLERQALEASGSEATLPARFAQAAAPELRSLILLNPAEYLQRLRIPVLALNGARDLQVSAQQNLPAISAALAAAGNPDFTVTALPGLNHLFQTCRTCQVSEYGQLEETFAPQALELIAAWIEQRTR